MLAIEAADVLLAKVQRLLLGIGINLDAEHFSPFTTHHLTDSTAHWRGKLHFRILFVDKQSIPGLDLITLFDNNLWSDTLEIIWH